MKRIIRMLICVCVLSVLCACAGTKESVQTGPRIAMKNTEGMTVTEAVKLLQTSGFTKIETDHQKFEGWDPDRIVIVSQSVAEGKEVPADQVIQLKCGRICQVVLNLESDINLLFNTYDMEVYFDDHHLGSVANGKTLSVTLDAVEGEHTLKAYKADEQSRSSTRTIDVTNNVNVSALIEHGGSVSFTNLQVTERSASTELCMPSVIGKVLSKGKTELESMGFTNLREEPSGEIWNRDNWIITEQSPEKDTTVYPQDEIVLTCVSLDDFFKYCLIGKNISEIEELSQAVGFHVRYRYNSELVTEKIGKLSEEGKQRYIAESARQYGGDDFTAEVTLKDTSVSAEEQTESTDTEIAAEEKTEETKPAQSSGLSYTTNSKQDAKKGNQGVYAYCSMGGTYKNYWIIDFDEGYVYFFSDGNGSGSCERVEMVEGDLNTCLIITYHDSDGSEWSYGMHFNWVNQPDTLVVQDQNGYEDKYYTAILKDALKLRDQKTMYDY